MTIVIALAGIVVVAVVAVAATIGVAGGIGRLCGAFVVEIGDLRLVFFIENG